MLPQTSRLWPVIACILAALTVAVCKATAATAKRPFHHNGRSHPKVHVLGERAASIARHMVGVPYRWGGSSPAGFDCSGLVMFAYGRLGVRLPHSSYGLLRIGRSVGRWALRPGDLVFFHGGGHVGVYLGRSRFVAATHSGDHVRISSLRDRWYAESYDGARRLPVAGKRRPV